MTILQLSKKLLAPPAAVAVPGVVVRNYAGPEDIEPCLELRHSAFAREAVGVRQWSPEDFAAEFLQKPWWRPERMWLAEATHSIGEPRLVGTVTLAARGPSMDATPAIHWLAVRPRWRRRGIGRLLIATLESACWESGLHEIYLETHTRWESARHFYAALGYLPAAPGV